MIKAIKNTITLNINHIDTNGKRQKWVLCLFYLYVCRQRSHVISLKGMDEISHDWLSLQGSNLIQVRKVSHYCPCNFYSTIWQWTRISFYFWPTLDNKECKCSFFKTQTKHSHEGGASLKISNLAIKLDITCDVFIYGV